MRERHAQQDNLLRKWEKTGLPTRTGTTSDVQSVCVILIPTKKNLHVQKHRAVQSL